MIVAIENPCLDALAPGPMFGRPPWGTTGTPGHPMEIEPSGRSCPGVRNSILFTALFVCCAACDEPETPTAATSAEITPTEATPAEATPAQAPEIPEPTPSQGLMHGHYQRAADAREALIRGDMDSARADMQWLAAHHEDEALAENLQPLLAQMQTGAARFAEATTLTEAGQALARTLVRCGNCHRESGGGFSVALPPLPEGDTSVAHMQRHLWAATRMWEGLVVADAEQFTAGTDALREAALHDLARNGQPPERVSALADHVHALGREAAGAADEDARADIYGRYLATCAACHRLLGTGPAAPPEPTTEE